MSQKDSITRAAEAIVRGDLVVFPTETVYGVGANALDAGAAAKIFAAKGRPAFNPLIVHLASIEQLSMVVAETPDWAKTLMQQFWPGPLTLVLPKRTNVPDIVTAGLPTVGVRIPAHPVAHDLLTRAGVPIAAPSANRFMSLSPTRVEDARIQLGDRVAEYVDGGPCTVGLESTIVGYTDGKPTLLRPGGVAPEAIAKVVGRLYAPADPGKIVAPGMLKRHYAPAVPVTLWSDNVRFLGATGLITLKASAEDRARYAKVEELSPSENLAEAAANLFSALRRLEGQGLERIVARLVPNEGLGIAINDRLSRAASGTNA